MNVSFRRKKICKSPSAVGHTEKSELGYDDDDPVCVFFQSVSSCNCSCKKSSVAFQKQSPDWPNLFELVTKHTGSRT